MKSLVDLGVSAGPPPSAGSGGGSFLPPPAVRPPTRVPGIVAASSLISASGLVEIFPGSRLPVLMKGRTQSLGAGGPRVWDDVTNHWEPYRLHLETRCFQHSEVPDMNLGGHYPAPSGLCVHPKAALPENAGLRGPHPSLQGRDPGVSGTR